MNLEMHTSPDAYESAVWGCGGVLTQYSVTDGHGRQAAPRPHDAPSLLALSRSHQACQKLGSTALQESSEFPLLLFDNMAAVTCAGMQHRMQGNAQRSAPGIRVAPMPMPFDLDD